MFLGPFTHVLVPSHSSRSAHICLGPLTSVSVYSHLFGSPYICPSLFTSAWARSYVSYSPLISFAQLTFVLVFSNLSVSSSGCVSSHIDWSVQIFLDLFLSWSPLICRSPLIYRSSHFTSVLVPHVCLRYLTSVLVHSHLPQSPLIYSSLLTSVWISLHLSRSSYISPASVISHLSWYPHIYPSLLTSAPISSHLFGSPYICHDLPI